MGRACHLQRWIAGMVHVDCLSTKILVKHGQRATHMQVRDICRENGLPLNPLAVTRLELNCQLLTEISPVLAEYTECMVRCCAW